MAEIVVNTRALYAPLTGVQRYIRQILHHVPELDTIAPVRPWMGPLGHAWEQMALPFSLKDRLLWSPSNSGAVSVRRQVVTVHDLAHVEHPEWMSTANASLYRCMFPPLFRNVQHILTISNFTRDAIMERYKVPAERISVVYNGVESTFAPRSPEQIAAAREICKIPRPNYVLSLCTLEPRKNLRRLLLAWDAIKPLVPDDLCLVLAGKKGPTSRYSSLDLGPISERVHFTGHVPDEHLPALLSGAAVFVYPSIYEGFGLPPLEAMACGAPVITTNTSAMPEVVGKAGRLVDPYDTDQMAQALLDVLGSEQLRRKMSVEGLERAKRFSWAQAASETLSVLRAVAHSARPVPLSSVPAVRA